MKATRLCKNSIIRVRQIKYAYDTHVWFEKIKYAYHTSYSYTRIIQFTVGKLQLWKRLRHNLQYSVYHENMCWRRSWKPVLSVLNVISTAKAETSAYQYSIGPTSNQAKLCRFCSSCAFDYFTEYFMLSRNGSVCFTIHTCDKITYAYHTHVWFKNKIRIIRMNRTACISSILIIGAMCCAQGRSIP